MMYPPSLRLPHVTAMVDGYGTGPVRGDGDLLLDSDFRVCGSATCLQRLLGTQAEARREERLGGPSLNPWEWHVHTGGFRGTTPGIVYIIYNIHVTWTLRGLDRSSSCVGTYCQVFGNFTFLEGLEAVLGGKLDTTSISA